MSSCIQPVLVINSFMYHSFYLITGPSKLIVTLKGEVKDDAQPNIAGTYILEPKLENGKSHWLQHTGTHAIWWYNNTGWVIGPQDNLGSSFASIVSYDNVTGPEEATTWQYVDALDRWITSDKILVDTFVEKGTYK